MTLSPSQEDEYCGEADEGCMEILCCPNIHDRIRSQARASTLKELRDKVSELFENGKDREYDRACLDVLALLPPNDDAPLLQEKGDSKV